MSRMISVISLGRTRTVDLATHYRLQFCRSTQKRSNCNILWRAHRQAYVQFWSWAGRFSRKYVGPCSSNMRNCAPAVCLWLNTVRSVIPHSAEFSLDNTPVGLEWCSTHCSVSGDTAYHSRERSDLGIAYLCQDFNNAVSACGGFLPLILLPVCGSRKNDVIPYGASLSNT
jgi:hypothetical protein